MKISIITPVYNAEATIEQTILSVIHQKVDAELEYIIIDGGSRDRTLDTIRQYAHRISHIVSEPDNGTYDAMNKGLQLATGDIVGIINGDDWYTENALELVAQVFREHPETTIVYSPIHSYFGGQYRNTFKPGSLENLAFRFTLNHPSCFVKRSVYEQVGTYDLSYKIAADYNFIFKAYHQGAKFHYIETPLASYSMNGFSGNSANRLQLIRESWRVGANVKPLLKLKRLLFYVEWVVLDTLMLPIRQLVNPHLRGKIKSLIRQRFGQLSGDKYGAW